MGSSLARPRNDLQTDCMSITKPFSWDLFIINMPICCVINSTGVADACGQFIGRCFQTDPNIVPNPDKTASNGQSAELYAQHIDCSTHPWCYLCHTNVFKTNSFVFRPTQPPEPSKHRNCAPRSSASNFNCQVGGEHTTKKTRGGWSERLGV